MKRLIFLPILFLGLFLGACSENPPVVQIPSQWQEPQPERVELCHSEFLYLGDDIGESYSDGWLIKLYTDMEVDEVGNPVGPGSVVQLLLNTRYNKQQEPDPICLVGSYRAPKNSGDFSPETFVPGYMDYIDLPTGRVERPDASFYAEVADSKTEMAVDLLDDGYVQITRDGEEYLIEGVLVGQQCLKRYIWWRGRVEALSRVEQRDPNTTLTTDLQLDGLVKGLLQDRGDYFALGDASCRSYLLFLASEGVSFSWGRPVGTGEVLRLELLVPWDSVAEEGIPAGSYPMLVRNADTSIDRDALAPYHAIPGLPDRFTYPYWSGCWYVDYLDDAWGESYARVDGGTIEVERTTDGGHLIRCHLSDSGSPAHTIRCEVELAPEHLEYF